jgi:hypothetical protein
LWDNNKKIDKLIVQRRKQFVLTNHTNHYWP